MSTDYFLYSPSLKKRVMVGSVGLSGVKVWPDEYGAREFLAQVIEEGIQDVALVDEHRLDVLDPDGESES